MKDQDRGRKAGASRFELAALAAVFIVVAIFTHVYNTKVAGGADSYGYVSEALRLSRFHFYEPERVFSPFHLPEDARLSRPLGLVSKGKEGTVPYYAFGYPLLMVPLIWLFGLKGAFWVIPLLAAGTVVLTYRLGRVLLGPTGGAFAAGLLLVFPNFLFSAFNPMSDVAAAFFATLALLALIAMRAGPWTDVLLGVSLGFGAWVRPNMVLMVVLVATWLVVRGEWRRLLSLALVLIPFALVEAGFNLHLYGSPWQMGYSEAPWGAPLADALARGGRYLARLHVQQAWVGLLLLGASLAFSRLSLAVRMLLLGVFATFLLFFAFYPFDDNWWYFRYLLPALPAVALAEAGFVNRLLEARRSKAWPKVLVVAAAAGFALVSLLLSKSYGLFRMFEEEQRYVRAAEMTRRLVKTPAVVLAMQHSGSLRLYGGLATTRYDITLAVQVPRLRAVEQAGGHIYLLADGNEVERLRAQYKDFDTHVRPLGCVEPKHVTLFEAESALGLRPGAQVNKKPPRGHPGARRNRQLGGRRRGS